MKKLRVLLALMTACVMPMTIAVITPGCNSPQQRITYNTLYTIGQAADKAYSAYNDLIVKGKLDASSLPTVAAAWNKYRAVFNLAVTANQNNLNAPAPAEVTLAAQELTDIITQFSK